MNCPNCGAENSPGIPFCVECGASLRPQTPPSTVPEPPEEPFDNEQTILSLSNPLRPSVDAPDISDKGRPEASVPPRLSETPPDPAIDAPPSPSEEPADIDVVESPQKPRKLLIVVGTCLTIIFFCICFAIIIVVVAAVSDPDGFEDLLRELSFIAGNQPLAMLFGLLSTFL
ncbi:MAG: zinc-ribbon domain-containing protein [Anaerolineae bacterium]|nr:zinc-ribbon domain-containing protein [Anaerolineae bacterium]